MGLKQEKCHHPGCNNLQTSSDNNYKGQPGVKYYRKWCREHYEEKRAKNAGVSKAEYARRTAERVAANAGMTVLEYRQWVLQQSAEKAGMTVAEYRNRNHPYRQFRLDYCENIDGRLGFKCVYPKTPFKEVSALLQVDHIDGNPQNNDPSNLQTLCPNCHTYKTHVYEDCKTPGRKTLGVK